MTWWVADYLQNNPVLLVSQVVWVIVAIVLHELAHGWMAIRLGDRTPIETGHMTWNPIVHMGLMSLLVFAMFGIAWGTMPVDPTRLRGRYAEVWVAMAGPAMNLILAVLMIVTCALWGKYAFSVGQPLYANFNEFFLVGAWINLFLMCFNLLPVPPLDGSRVLAAFSPAFRRLVDHPHAPLFMLMGIFFVWRSFGSPVAAAIGDFVIQAISTLSGWLP